jgi:N-methylhydantoinase B
MNEESDQHRGTKSVDPITLEVIRHGIVSITDQIDANISRTAFSPYIYEYKDFAVGLVGADGELIAQCTGGMPVFVADSVGMAVRDGLAVYGRERLQRGDVVLCNHAAIQGQHLNNTVMYTPIYAGPAYGTLVGFFAINVHWIDIGGITPRSSDIFMEGLQLRSIKLWSKGEPIQEVYRIIENNTRFPVELLGDIAAQHAGCVLGRDLTQTLVEKYGVETFFGSVKTMLDQGEAAARAKISAIPDGEYSYETFFDNDGETDDTLTIRVKVLIAGDEMTIDYSGIAAQVRGCINSGYYGGGRTTARVAFKYLIAHDEPANEGTFRPLKLILPEGKILSAHPTAPMGNYSQPFPTVIDAIIKALERPCPSASRAHTSEPFPGSASAVGATTAPCSIVTTAATVAGAPARPTTARDPFAPWRTAIHELFPSSCRNLCIRIESLSSACGRTRAAPASFAAGWAFASATKSLAAVTCKRCSIA